MNFLQLRNEAYRMTGALSYLNPDTDTSYNGGPYLNWVINEAIRNIAGWVDPERSVIHRFSFLKSSLLFKTTHYKFDVETEGTDTNIILPAAVPGTDDEQYKNWIIRRGSESYVISSYTGSTKTGLIAGEWKSKPEVGDEVELCKRFYFLSTDDFAWHGENILIPNNTNLFLADGNFVEVLKIKDITNKAELEEADRAESFIGSLTDSGVPGMWYRFGNQVIFDVAPNKDIWYELEYYRTPSELVNDDDVPELPESYQFGIILWVRYWAYMRLQDFTAAYSAKRDLVDFMRSKMNMTDASKERKFSHGRLQLR